MGAFKTVPEVKIHDNTTSAHYDMPYTIFYSQYINNFRLNLTNFLDLIQP